MSSKFALIVIGYNRVDCIARLLDSLNNAFYMNDKVDLIISIDNSGRDDVEAYAQSFEWLHGEKIIRTFKERQGLRRHVLKCGAMVRNYDAIAVLEDDIVVAPGFYQYMKEAVEFYKNDDRIAGISLYNHLYNLNVNQNFIPAPSDSDVYFLQFAQSWGQIWMKDQWLEFEQWYNKNKMPINETENLPKFITNWPETSWLKYHIKFCVEKNKYFVYPYNSLSTCFSDVGQHCKRKNTLLQVPISMDIKKEYKFVNLDNAKVIYDVFFERKNIEEWLGLSKGSLCVDLYGSKVKPDSSNISYMLTCKVLNYRILKTYGLDLKPHENNIKMNIEGDVFRLYDLNIEENNSMLDDNELDRFVYYQKIYNCSLKLLLILKQRIIEKIFERLRILLNFKRD